MIGILTFHHVYNYGAVLQAYALKEFLQEHGFEAEIVNLPTFFRPKPGVIRPSFSIGYLKYMFAALFDKNFSHYKKECSIKADWFDKFRAKYLKLGKNFDSIQSYLEYRKEIDCLIVGSDQIWNPRFGTRALATYFLKDVPDRVKKVSYAGCIGSLDLSGEKFVLLEKYAHLIDSFNLITTRDDFTREYLASKTDKSIDVVVDPTLLIDWGRKIDVDARCNIPTDYIFVYGNSELIESYLKKCRTILGLPVVMVGMENDLRSDLADIFLNDVSPLGWVDLIKRSSYVVTKSFHGLMFALKFNKHVAVISDNHASLARMKDMCAKLGLDDVLISSTAEDITRIEQCGGKIDYGVVNNLLDNLIKKSKRLLIEFLESCAQR